MNLLNRSLLLLFGCSLIFLSCGQFGPDDGKPHKKPAAIDNTAALLARPGVFTNAPAKIEGCEGLYTYDSLNIPFDNLDVDKGQKIFAIKSSAFGYFKMGGHDVYLGYDSSQSRRLDDKTIKEVFRGNGYVAVLIVKTLEGEGEAVWEEGTLEIVKGVKRVKIKVRGLSGC